MAKGTRDSGLGRGLSALLGEAALEPEQQGVTQLPIEKVQPNAAQPRKFFAPESISDLADSIRIHGVIQPLTVRETGETLRAEALSGKALEILEAGGIKPLMRKRFGK